MNEYKETLRFNDFGYDIEIMYSEGDTSMQLDFLKDEKSLPDDDGVDRTLSHYIAYALSDEKIITSAAGQTRRTAVFNLYRQIAENAAHNIIDKFFDQNVIF